MNDSALPLERRKSSSEPRQTPGRFCLRPMLGLILALALAGTARAATYTVTISTDQATGSYSLRSAIIAANANSGSDTIILQTAAAYALTVGPADSALGAATAAGGDLDITDDLTIEGNSASLNANSLDRAFYIDGSGKGRNITVTINNLTISGGRCASGALLAQGGGIFSRATNLTLNNCTVSDCATGENGGGIAFAGLLTIPLPTLQLTNCTIQSCTANQGGGVFVNRGTVILNGGRIQNNQASSAIGNQGGGGLFCVGDISTVSTLNGVQISSNQSNTNGGGAALFGGQWTGNNTVLGLNNARLDGGGIYSSAFSPGLVTLTSSDLSGNRADSDANLSGSGGAFYKNGRYGAGTLKNTFHFCRFYGNTGQSGANLRSDATDAVIADNNWWGTNTPTTASLTGTVTYSPWLTLTLAGAPPAIAPSASSTLTARLIQNSLGQDTSAQGFIRNGTPLGFSSLLGSFGGAATAFTNGVGTAVFNAGATGGVNAAAVTVDGATLRAVDIVQLQTTLAPGAQTQKINTPAQVTATVLLNGSPLAGQAVTFTPQNNPAAALTVSTNPSGQALFSYTSAAAGHDPVNISGTYTDQGQSFPLSAAPASVDWVNPVLTVTTPNQAATSGSLAAVPVTLTLDGNPVAGRSLTYAVISGPNMGLTSSTTTNAAGQADLRYRGHGNGVDTLNVSGSVIANSVTFPLSATAQIRWVTLSLTAQPNSAVQLTGTTFTLTAALTIDGAAAAGQAIRLQVMSGPDLGTTSTKTTDANGRTSISLHNNGTLGNDAIALTGMVNIDNTTLTATANASAAWVATVSSVGTVRIEVTPTSTTWTLNSGYGYQREGAGNSAVPNVPAGPVTITWHPPAHYDPALPPTATQTLAPDGSILFTQFLVPSASGPARTRARLLQYLLGYSSDPTGLDLNSDSLIDVADLLKQIITP